MLIKTISALAMVGAILPCTGAIAQTTPPAETSPEQAVPIDAPASQRLPILLDTDELQASRGGTTIIVNNQTLSAVNSGNVLGDFVAGDVFFSDNALSNFSGIGNFTINTGAQNNLQTGMILTVNIAD